jgi:hypothetical protein
MGVLAPLLGFIAFIALALGGASSVAGMPDRSLPWQTADARVPGVEYRTFDSKVVGCMGPRGASRAFARSRASSKKACGPAGSRR